MVFPLSTWSLPQHLYLTTFKPHLLCIIHLWFSIAGWEASELLFACSCKPMSMPAFPLGLGHGVKGVTVTHVPRAAFSRKEQLVGLEMQLCLSDRGSVLESNGGISNFQALWQKTGHNQLKRRKNIFWFMVLKVPGHGQQDLLLWAYEAEPREVWVWGVLIPLQGHIINDLIFSNQILPSMNCATIWQSSLWNMVFEGHWGKQTITNG